MATLANFFGWIVGSKAFENASTHAATAAADPYVLRAIPNEDIYFFVKDINNARVVRASDPQSRTACCFCETL